MCINKTTGSIFFWNKMKFHKYYNDKSKVKNTIYYESYYRMVNRFVLFMDLNYYPYQGSPCIIHDTVSLIIVKVILHHISEGNFICIKRFETESTQLFQISINDSIVHLRLHPMQYRYLFQRSHTIFDFIIIYQFTYMNCWVNLSMEVHRPRSNVLLVYYNVK